MKGSKAANPETSPKRSWRARHPAGTHALLMVGVLLLYFAWRAEPPLALTCWEPTRTIITLRYSYRSNVRRHALRTVGWICPDNSNVASEVAGWLDHPRYRGSALTGLMAFQTDTRIKGLSKALRTLKTVDGRLAAANMLCLAAVLAGDNRTQDEATHVLARLGEQGEMTTDIWREVVHVVH